MGSLPLPLHSFIVGIFCLWVTSIVAGSAAQAEDATVRSDLVGLVWSYVMTDDPTQADHLKQSILSHPDASVQRVQRIIRERPHYGAQPVGVLADERVVVRERPYRYSLYVPPNYEPTREYPLVVCLHGAGFTGEAYLERWQPRLGDRYILVCPTYPGGAWFTRGAEDLVLETLRAVVFRYHVDPDRIFLTGMSNGGIGTWLIGMHHAPRFAGIAPMAAGIDDVLFPFLQNLLTTPIYILHGARDNIMPVELSRLIAKELTRLGYLFAYREHDRTHPMAGGHFFPREELPQLVAWFDAQRRIPLPKSITVVRDASHLLPYAWVRIDATDEIAAFSEDLIDKRDDPIRNRIYARLTAQITAPNHIDIRTERVRQYTVFLNESLVDQAQPVVVTTNGKVSYEGPVKPNLDTLLNQARLRYDPVVTFSSQLTITLQPSS